MGCCCCGAGCCGATPLSANWPLRRGCLAAGTSACCCRCCCCAGCCVRAGGAGPTPAAARRAGGGISISSLRGSICTPAGIILPMLDTHRCSGRARSPRSVSSSGPARTERDEQRRLRPQHTGQAKRRPFWATLIVPAADICTRLACRGRGVACSEHDREKTCHAAQHTSAPCSLEAGCHAVTWQAGGGSTGCSACGCTSGMRTERASMRAPRRADTATTGRAAPT